MLSKLWRVHMRLGFTRALFIVDLVFVVLILWDLGRFLFEGFSIGPIFHPGGLTSPSEIGWALCCFFLCLAVLLPIALAVAKIAAIPGFATLNPSAYPTWLALLHLALCLTFVACALIAQRMEMLSGWRQIDENHFTPLFHSVFLGLVTQPVFAKVLKAITAAGSFSVFAAVTFLLVGDKGGGKMYKQYVTRALLADMPSELQPERSLFRAALTGAEANRTIPAVRSLSEKYADIYQKEMHTRSQKFDYVRELLAQCRQSIRETLCEGAGQLNPEVWDERLALFLDEQDALLAALSGMEFHPDAIVVLPNCAPHLTCEMKSYASVMGVPFVQVESQLDDLYSGRSTEDALISELEKLRSSYHNVIVLTAHVHYATGLKLPVGSFLARMRRALDPMSIYTIVDGTNAVGNACLVPVGADWDAYFFAPERWLLAPEALSVLITRKRLTEQAGSLEHVHRSFDSALRAIAGFKASLEVLSGHGLNRLWDRCRDLRNAFVEGLPRSFGLVGGTSAGGTTFILSCYPGPTGSWKKTPQELNDAVGKYCSTASLLSIDGQRPWLRVSFPYYLDSRDLNRLNSFLAENTFE